MRVGTLCYATDQGLGILAKSFYDAGIVTDAIVVKHSSRVTHYDWYPESKTTPSNFINMPAVADLLSKVDAMLFFETPFYWNIIDMCRDKGIPTFMMPMYECMPKELPATSDYFICPSLLDLDYYPDNSIYLPVPVNVPWKQRTEAKVFVHNSGHGGLRGRNGTIELLQAMQYVQSPIKLILRSQDPISNTIKLDPRITLRMGNTPYNELWEEGDVFVFPEKFNGLSLPLQEARASGMLVMSTDRFPMNTWLPRPPLIRSKGWVRAAVSGRCHEFEEAILDPKQIAERIDEYYGRDITQYSLEGKEWAETMTWEKLAPKYRDILANGVPSPCV